MVGQMHGKKIKAISVGVGVRTGFSSVERFISACCKKVRPHARHGGPSQSLGKSREEPKQGAVYRKMTEVSVLRGNLLRFPENPPARVWGNPPRTTRRSTLRRSSVASPFGNPPRGEIPRDA